MFSIVSLDESNKWDKIIKSFLNYDIYYLSKYTKAFQIHGDGEPTLFFYENKDLRAVNVVMKRDIENNDLFSGKVPTNTLFDITTPYGYGGFLVEGEITDDSLKTFEKEYTSLCQNRGIISEFVRFHPVLGNVEKLRSIYNVSDLGRTITMELNTHEQIWNELTSKNRNVIRKAKKSGVKIYWGRSPELYSEFISLYNATMDKADANNYYYFQKDFYESVLLDLKYNSMMFYAVFEGNIIAMSMVLFSNKQMHYHLSASNRDFLHLAPTNLLLYEAACWGCENGYTTFHLGGGLGSKEDSLFKFKKAFNKNSNTKFSIGRKIFSKEKYDELVKIRYENAHINGIDFFPKYRFYDEKQV